MTTRAAMIEAVRRAWDRCHQRATDPLSSIERRAFYTVQAALLAADADALAAEDWRPGEPPDTMKDGRKVLLWVCTRGSIRRGWPELCWWGDHPHHGPAWLRNEGRDIVGLGVALMWMEVPAPPDREG